jgi:pimeloyl-ACP methyl ester carboxylesterase
MSAAQEAARSLEWNLDAMKQWEAGLHQRVDARDAATRIQSETLIVSGAHDWLAGPHAASRARDAIRGAEMLTLDDCGHYPDIEGDEAFVSAVRDFVRSPGC